MQTVLQPINLTLKKLAMNKILLIIEREFMSRVKKKSFIIMTLLGPLFFGAIMVGPMLLAMYGRDDSKKSIVES